MKLKQTTYALFPIAQLANIATWIITGLSVKKLEFVSGIACVFMAFVIYYSAKKINEDKK